MITAIDTNIISALWSKEPLATQIAESLFEARKKGSLVIAGPVYSELLAYPGANKKFIDTFLSKSEIEVDYYLSKEVWIFSGEAFAKYSERRKKSSGGDPKRLLTDFIIGAHASIHASTLMTLDKNRYTSAFPDLHII